MTLDIWVDLVLIVLLGVALAQNIGLAERLRKIEARLERST